MPDDVSTAEPYSVKRPRLFYLRVAATILYLAAFTILVVSYTRWATPFLAVVCSLRLIYAFTSRYPLRFSLRSLLIATTLLAFVLGLAVWVGR